MFDVKYRDINLDDLNLSEDKRTLFSKVIEKAISSFDQHFKFLKSISSGLVNRKNSFSDFIPNHSDEMFLVIYDTIKLNLSVKELPNEFEASQVKLSFLAFQDENGSLISDGIGNPLKSFHIFFSLKSGYNYVPSRYSTKLNELYRKIPKSRLSPSFLANGVIYHVMISTPHLKNQISVYL